MIDLHCHILPGLDDGAVDMNDSVAMGLQAAEDGIELVCATPHIRHDHDVRILELAERVKAVNDELARREVTTRVAPGGEVAETAVKTTDDAQLELVSLGGGGKWILLEPAPGPLSSSFLEAVNDLAEQGYRTVVAHPERHGGPDMVERLAELVDLGCLVQATAAYFLDDRAPWMLGLAGAGLVHVLGSDSHSARAGRPVALAAALAKLREVALLAPHVDWIARDAPTAIVRGESVEPPYGATPF